MALSEYDKKNLSAAQQQEIQRLTDEYTKLYNEQKAAKEAGNTSLVDSLFQKMSNLHDQAENIRLGVGYSGGDDGTAYVEIPETTVVKQPTTTDAGKAYTVYTGTGVLNDKTPATGSGTSGSQSSLKTNSASQTSSVSAKSATETAPNPDLVMSAEDQARVEYYRQIYNDAQALGDMAAMEAAHRSVEDIRATYGYSGGEDGSQYITQGVEKPVGTHNDNTLSAESQKVVDDARLNYYIAQFNNDLEEMSHWHTVAEEERRKYGYSGGADGSEYIELPTVPEESKKPANTTPKQETGTTPTTPKQETVEKPETVEPETLIPEIVLPEIPAFSNLAVPDLNGIGTPAAPGFDKIQMPTLPELETLTVPAAPDVKINDYSRYIQEMQDAQTKAALTELEGAYQKNVSTIDRAGVGVDLAYQSARNQTAGAADLASRNFAEMANASGLSSGAGGQAALARSVAMQNDMNKLNMQQAQIVADLEQQLSDNETWYNSAIAQAEAEGDAQTAQLLYQEKIRVESETVAAIQQKFTNEITRYQQQMDARQQQFANEVSQYQMQVEAQQQQFKNEVSMYQMQMDTQQQQFNNEVSKKKLEYQQLRDNVADAQWQAEFDRAYKQWVQQVEQQQKQMEFEREQWETSVAVQREQMDIAYEQWLQDVATEQAQMDFEREQWVQNVTVQQEQLAMQQKSLEAELEQIGVENSWWQQEFDSANSRWQQEFDAESERWLQEFNADLLEYRMNGVESQLQALAEYGMAYLRAGVMPSTEMLDAMGVSAADAQRYIDELNRTEEEIGQDGWNENDEDSNGVVALVQRLTAAGMDPDSIRSYLARTGKSGNTVGNWQKVML